MNTIEQEFVDKIRTEYQWDCSAFLDREILHWTTKISPEDTIEYDFKRSIADHFWIDIDYIYVVWSAKLWYSIWKWTPFSYDSDIDIAITSTKCFYWHMKYVEDLDYYLKDNPTFYNWKDLEKYLEFLRYIARGWFRPDKIPKLIPEDDFLQISWFDYFKSISWKNCVLWDYQIKCWLYRNKDTLRRYQLDWIQKKFISLTNP